MKTNLVRYLCSAIIVTAAASLPATAQIAGSSEWLTHMPMQASRNADGSIKRGLRNVVQNGYWSGFAATAGAPYNSASGTFQVPSVTYSGSGHSYED